jgi:hypothetical protein
MSPRERFNVTIVAPEGYGFSETFREIGETLCFGLAALGYEATLAVNEFKHDATNLVLGAHLLDERTAAELPASTLLYNFEQVYGGSPWIKPLYIDLVRRFPLWDYSERNIDKWRRFCPTAGLTHVPLGYVPELTRISAAEDQDIDVLFYGVLNDRRRRILDQLIRDGLNVHAVAGLFGAERDALIARAKVVLNVHFYDTKIFEVPRVSYLLANRKAVVAEVDDDTEIDAGIRAGIAGVPYADLARRCIELVFDDVVRERQATAGFESFRRRPETEILSAALASRSVRERTETVELPRRMNVGSGRGWNLECLNLDVDPGWRPDLVADLNSPLPPPGPVDLGRFGVRTLPANYFDEIVASHVLEHVRELVTAMESFLSLLRQDGIVDIEVPYDLSHGAWQDPTHVRAMNERSWIYYCDWFWYLGWREHRFEIVDSTYIISELGVRLLSPDGVLDEVARTPRAVDAIRVRLRKIPLTAAEKLRVSQRWGQ